MTCLSIDRIARFVSLAWLMVDRKYVFINFSFEKRLSQLAILTHIVKNIRSAIVRFGRHSANPYFTNHLKISNASQLFAFFSLINATF